ncbi:cytochrome P450 [Laetiporus sulphureus 93-53]|uniref:Cytochrome P450 n=1 Tax=Laetiporus sulphureus 93-53 TaxID=1314785 RepID=A0A165HIM6_9APHY|nr:cytochrome P450 [Laetiporus sulphureus 93-53]KZT11776.1 cytochrome P450 [Laetiporus sulphureus 93-53]
MLMLYFLGFSLLYIVYERLALSPLSRVPGPPLAAITRLVLMYYEFTRQRRRWVHALHMRYGPVVRIAPSEVSFATWDAVKEIYIVDGSGYDKTTFYRMFDNYETMCMFSTIDKVPHGERKKRFADRYNKSYIMQPETMTGIQERAEQFVEKCTEKPGAPVDIYIYLHCYALDCVTYHLFDPLGMQSLTQASDLLRVKELSYHDNMPESYLEHYLGDFPHIARLFRRHDRSKVLSTRVLSIARRSDVAAHTVLHKLQHLRDPPLDTKSIASELMDHTVAGIDTTGDGLCFLMHHLSLPATAPVQEKLRRELAENIGVPIDDLAYLDAVVKESLRCFSPLPMSLPRRVPKGGRTLAGVFLPEDTVVSAQAYTLHRFDTTVFHDPDEFIPERWLEPEGTTERNQLFFAFGAGGRGCIGKHLALLEMKMLLREVYSAYRTNVAPEMKASMEQDDQFISSRPKDQTCLVTFEKAI